MSRNTKILIGCGVLVAVCVVATVALGGVGALIAYFNIAPAPEMQVRVDPSTVTTGGTYQVIVTLKNTSGAPISINEVRLPQNLVSSSQFLGSNLASGGSASGDSMVYTLNLTLGTGETRDITFDFRANSPGDFNGMVIASNTSQPVRVVIAQGQADPGPTQAVTNPPTQPPAQNLGVFPYQAVVQIIAMFNDGGQLVRGWTGSGSIIDSNGLILTNAHVVLPDKYYTVDALMVALTVQEDRPPVPTYYAEVLQADPELDIAVIRLTTDLDGNPIDRANLNLPVVPLGNSDVMRLGDPITIIGYPGIGGDTVTLTRGEVSGFTSEPGRGDRAFIKTSATIAGGNSGGLAANANGELIGVPTQLGYGGDDQYVDCRVLADTNRDGFIDENDNCVPTGGFINALRPLTLAFPYIEAARRGEVAIGSQGSTAEEVPVEGNVLFSDNFSDPNSGWDVGSNDEVSVYYSEGEYFIEVNPDNYYAWSNPYQWFEDVIIQVVGYPYQTTGEGDYGVLCRYQDVDNFYALEISEDGYYSIWKMENGETISLVDWEYSAVIPTDGSQVLITAGCIENRLVLVVGETVLAEVIDNSFSAGDVGLIAGTWNTGGFIIGFDNYEVYAP